MRRARIRRIRRSPDFGHPGSVPTNHPQKEMTSHSRYAVSNVCRCNDDDGGENRTNRTAAAADSCDSTSRIFIRILCGAGARVYERKHGARLIKTAAVGRVAEGFVVVRLRSSALGRRARTRGERRGDGSLGTSSLPARQTPH